jgi:hypothetical protein
MCELGIWSYRDYLLLLARIRSDRKLRSKVVLGVLRAWVSL